MTLEKKQKMPLFLWDYFFSAALLKLSSLWEQHLFLQSVFYV